MNKIAVFITKGDSFKDIEGETAQRVSKYLLRDKDEKTLNIFEVEEGDLLKIKDLHKYEGYEVVVFINGILFITYEGINVLSRMILNQKEFSVIAPVSNEGKVLHQRHAPPFLYQTISVFRWAAGEIYKEFKNTIIEVNEVDDFCLVFRKKLLNVLPDDLNIIDLLQIIKNRGLKIGIAKGVYVHRYGNVYESGREDLLAHVPSDAKNILDVGCARGLFGELLKKRQKCVVTGVDTDNELINIAKNRLDNVIHGDIEEILNKGILRTYDCIVCGDLLEHLCNPWKVVKGLKSHLRKEGLFIASTPNISNWAIIFEMLKGEWNYVPFSILSGTHIRFFTRKTFTELFKEAGYKIKEISFQSVGVPPLGIEFIAYLKNRMTEINEEEIKSSEIVIVAEV
ncbi:MAG: class I SAM-dependent methyltransferase [Nitrospirota bacterium]